MLKVRSFLKLFLLLFIVQNSFSAIEVYTKEESQCGNLSVQRIYLKNTGTQDLQGFKFYYYFLTSPYKNIVLEDWYTPGADVSFEQVNGNVYRVKFDASNTTIAAGGVYPDNGGTSTGLHYSTWSTWDKNDDPSYLNASAFAINQCIPVYDISGSLISGSEPVFPLPSGELSLKVFVKDEVLTSPNQSSPRFYIENDGTQIISDFKMVYYFKVEADKTPVLGEYWIPDCAAELSHVRDNVYKVEFTFNGVSLDPGEVLPNTSGYVFGLYYSDWSQWDKSNDVSNTQSYNFVESNMVPVYNSSGVLVHGIDFFNNPQFYSLSAISHG